ncbi:hypothetical protein [Streptomyces sp. ST2-7A]|uniref:hypothetical protein n=1 Tax=Streptomyces sp. ST2-7A TaxID=2907214 RepID=UPI001F20997F|nr:hypothetical protein [Streptomyces sp. ST2-7A]MCE7078842.1 hypothetical protein [Streptomyces sp. ST2-7A]
MNQPTTTAAGTARAAAEAIRTLNHLTFRPDAEAEWEMPGDVYSVIGALAYLVGRLPQTLRQAGELLEALHGTGRLRHDSGDPARLDTDVHNLHAATEQATTMASMLARALSDAHNDLAHIGYRDEEER